MTLVFAFDRDWTVDVNPHPRHEAVPLEWVRHLAHETEHAVYAIGNQDLAAEAAVPGVVDIVGMHPDDWDEWLGGKRPDGRYERFPTRRERLSLIADLHPDADGYVVVDDLDLSDVFGWDHYHAWEFVPAVERGALDPSLPWVGPVTDGGRPTSAGVTPVDAAHLNEWLDGFEAGRPFRLRYRHDGETRTELVVDLHQSRASKRRPSARPAYRAVSVDDGGQRAIPFAHVEHVATVDPGEVRPDAETPAARAAALRRLADRVPAFVSVSAVLTVLEHGGEPAREDALAALRSLAADRPGACTPGLPILRSLLLAETEGAADALETLADVAAASPADVAPHTDVVVGFLASDDVAVRVAAARCLSEVAEADPADAVDAVPALAPLLDDRDAALPHVTYALCRVASEFPEELRPLTPALGRLVASDAVADGVRLSASAALGRVTGEYPDAALDVVDDLVELLDSDNDRLQNNAVGLLGDVALVHTDAVEPHVDDIVPFLLVDDDYARTNATAALARVAEDFPDSVAGHVPTFVSRLDDPEAMVRENACWALGYLRADSAADALAEATDDEAERVRRRAQWALDRL